MGKYDLAVKALSNVCRSNKTKTPEKLLEMGQYFYSTGRTKLATGIFTKGVEIHPTHVGLIKLKGFLGEVPESVFMQDLSRCLELNPSSYEAYLTRASMLLDNGQTATGINDLKKALQFAEKQKADKSLIQELKDFITGYTAPKKVKTIQHLPLTEEQIKFNKTVDNYMSKYSKEIDAFFEESATLPKSNVNCEMLETTRKQHLLSSIKRTGKKEDFNISDVLYHGTNAEAKTAIEKYGFDLSKNTRYESGQGAYFGFDRRAIEKGYGSSIVRGKFTGDKIAEVEPGVFSVVQENTFTRFGLADLLGLDMCNPETQKIVDEITNRYYGRILQQQNITGLYVKGSLTAGCEYFVIPEPAKYLEIL